MINPPPLQFEKAEFHAPTAAATCASCKAPIANQYFTLGTHTFCEACRDQISATFAQGSAAARFLKATVFGVSAGIVGAAIWWAVGHFLGWNIGLVAILIGYLVGTSVRRGSENRGGLTYQILAVALTYSAICWSTIPAIADDLVREASLAPGAPTWILAFFISFAAPFLHVFGPLTLLIIAFGLFEAWRRNTALVFNFAGPFAISSTPPLNG